MTRMGGKKDPHYRVVVAEKRGPRDGRFVESVGYYNPALNPVRLNLDLERVDYWIGKGAQPSETVKSLINRVKNQGDVPAGKTEKAEETQAEEIKEAETAEPVAKEPVVAKESEKE